MEHTDREFCLEVWGDMACFTRPELKVERVSYDVITPAAVRAVFEAIFWKPAIRWQPTRIEVLHPIKWDSVRRNEVGATASVRAGSPIFIEDKRQQRNTLLLRDVAYRLHARMVYIPIPRRKPETLCHKPGNDENPMKYYQMFERRAAAGQCFNQPYLGTRECAASFRLVREGETLRTPIDESRDLGLMLYDMDFTDATNVKPLFFRAVMHHGVIEVPDLNSEEVMR